MTNDPKFKFQTDDILTETVKGSTFIYRVLQTWEHVDTCVPGSHFHHLGYDLLSLTEDARTWKLSRDHVESRCERIGRSMPADYVEETIRTQAEKIEKLTRQLEATQKCYQHEYDRRQKLELKVHAEQRLNLDLKEVNAVLHRQRDNAHASAERYRKERESVVESHQELLEKLADKDEEIQGLTHDYAKSLAADKELKDKLKVFETAEEMYTPMAEAMGIPKSWLSRKAQVEEVEALKKQLKRAMEALDMRCADLEATKAQRDQWQAEAETRKVRNAESDTRIAHLSEQLLKYGIQVSEANGRIGRLEVALNREMKLAEERRIDYVVAKDHYETAKKNLDAAQHRIKELEARPSDAESKLKGLQSALDSLHTQEKHERSMRQRAERILEKKHEDIAGLSRKIDIARRAIDERDRVIDIIRKHVTDLGAVVIPEKVTL